jgi:hypothetical protein
LTLLGNLSAGQEAAYKQIMGELDPEALLTPALVEFAAARDFGSNLFGCAGADAGAKCVWSRIERNGYSRNAKEGGKPFEQKDNAQLRTGVQLPFQDDWVLAAAAGYDDGSELRVDGDRATGESEGVHAGVALRPNFGADARGAISVGVSGGLQWVDMKRRQSVFASGAGSSKFRNDYVAFNADARYTLSTGAVFARPQLNVSYVGLGQRGFEETGLAGLGIEGLRSRDWISTAAPKSRWGRT